jgi:Transglycosylase SLT domain
MSSVRSLRGSARLLALGTLAGSAALAVSTAIPASAAPAHSSGPAGAAPPAAVTAPRTLDRPALDLTALTVGSWTQTQAAAHRVQAGLSAKDAAAKAATAKAAAAKAAAARAAASGDPRTIAKAMLGQFQWQASQFSDLDKLWFHESGWQVSATNPGSGAYGIPQSLPASQMASAGPDWRTNPATQIKWGLTYIHDRYGSPSGAWAHEQSRNWY